jgi:hypothetical protein
MDLLITMIVLYILVGVITYIPVCIREKNYKQELYSEWYFIIGNWLPLLIDITTIAKEYGPTIVIDIIRTKYNKPGVTYWTVNVLEMIDEENNK